jgi:hypothetical protein
MVTNWPGPDWIAWLTLGLVAASVIIAAAALGVAVVTLRRIDKQIKIALEEMGYVKIDLENNQKQMAEFMRRPRLRLSGARTIQYQTGGQDADTIAFTLYVSNAGERGADHHLLELLVPLEADYHRSKASLNDPGVRVVNGNPYFVYPSTGGWLFPSGIPAVYAPHIVIHKPLERVQFLWRMYDEFAKYPRDNYGTVDIAMNTLMADLKPELTGPPDEVR